MSRPGVIIARPDPVIAQRNIWIDAQMSTPKIGANVVSQFLCEPNATTHGVDVSFQIVERTGISSVILLRAAVQDIKQATVLQTWSASASAFTWSDTDKRLQQTGQAFYWLKLEPVANGTEQIAGPQFILLNPSLLPPLACTGISASHAAAVNSTVLVTCNVAGVPSDGSVKVYVTGYKGNASPVAVGQKVGTPVQFTLQATGETVTFKAIGVSPGGAEAASGPTCLLTLTGSATAPAQPQGVTVAQIATGNQVMWPASLEQGVTGYQMWRGDRGTAFAAATLLDTIVASGAGTLVYLDLGGLGGDFQYFVVTVTGAGSSAASAPANPQVLFSSALVPPNVGANTTNSANLDSIDAGASATIRAYGGGGPGTAYTRKLGYGNASRPGGSIAGLAYVTKYYVIYNAGAYLASSTYSDTLPDGYEFVGVLTTCAAGYSGGGTGASAVVNCMPIPPFTTLNCTVTVGGYGYGSATATCSAIPGATFNVYCSGGSVSSISVAIAGSGMALGPFPLTITQTSAYYGGGGTANGGARYQLVG